MLHNKNLEDMLRGIFTIPVKISGHQQRWLRPLPGTILIPPALLVIADFAPGLHRRVMPLLFFVKGIEQKLGHVNDPRTCPAG